MRTVNAFIAAGETDPGRQRDVNEDRFHCDATRGLFIVIDGVGGQAAGGKAADVALSTLRKRLQRNTASASTRVREAITSANNEIYRLACTRPQWSGMACVLTVAVVDNGRATIGHVGDTRLYKLRDEHIEKITRDHSPVGEREDSNELSELEAMRHPRRNEVYRDVGSEPHEPDDPDFIDIEEISFEADAALLLCSDGLTDLIDSGTIANVSRQFAGKPEAAAQRLIAMANAAGGKDNVTVVYVEGEKFAMSQRRRTAMPRNDESVAATTPAQKRLLRSAFFALSLLVLGFAVGRTDLWLPYLQSQVIRPPAVVADVQVVQPMESIAAAIARAAPGAQVIVEPGEYRERVFLKDGIRLMSRLPRAAIIRLPSTASDTDFTPAVVAAGLTRADLAGFKIIGDAATPLGVGIGITGGALSVIDVEIVGATSAGIDLGEGSTATILGSEIHDNPGAAMIIRAGANPRIANNVFSRNGMSERSSGNFVLEQGATPVFQRNIFFGVSPDVFVTMDETARLAVKNLNWFFPIREPVRPPRAPSAGGRQSTP